MKGLFKYVKPYLPYFIIGPILMIVEVIGEVLLPKLMSVIINEGVGGRDVGFIVQIGVVMLIVAVFMLLGGVGGNYFSAKASISFSTDLRKDVFGKVQDFSFKNVDDFSTGSLVTRLTNDITQVQNMMRMALIMLLRAPGMLIGALIMSMTINSKLTAIIGVIIPILLVTLAMILRIGFPRFNKMQKKLDALNSRIQESLTNIRVVKSFVRGGYEQEKFEASNRDLKESTLSAMKIVVFTMPVMMLFMNITTIAVVWFGGGFVINGGMQVGDLTAFTTYVVQILMSLMMLSMVLLQGSRAMASLKRIQEVLNTDIDLVDQKDVEKDLKVTQGKVEFRHVSFAYKEDANEPVLADISFMANPGEVVGIIGATGCGKTSLVQLIPRLYDTTKGEVLVDDINVKDYPIKNLRDGVGMVLQKNVLFSGTIEENLLWGNEDASEEALQTAADHAQAAPFIDNFKEGYQTTLEQGGSNVSGGQKQRLCIARALLKKPKILILDDSTSAVDTATEAKIRASFHTDLKDTTVLIIAQRITSVMDANRILVLDDGKIVGDGTHEQLLESNEEYQEIYYSQKEKGESA